MATRRKVLIVGGGISGLTLAAALGQRGHAVDLVEIKPALEDGGGVGLSLVSNALRALDAIGIADQCVAQGVPADSMAMLRPDGNLLFENPLPRIGGPKWPGSTGIARSVFHNLLKDAALQAGITVRCGTTLADWTENDDGVVARLSDGTERCYDAIVGAEGLYSQLRGRLMADVRPIFTGQSVWRAPVPRAHGVDRTHIVVGGKHGVVGLCPVGPDLAYLYIVESAPAGLRLDPATLDAQMIEKLEGYDGVIAQAAATIGSAETVNYRPLEWILAPRPWGQGRLVMIGDAVHANPPVIAQGAAMGIEDAIVLAAEFDGAGGVDQCLARFIDRRYGRAAHVVETSCQLARWEAEHTPGVDVAGVMRDAAMRLAEPV